MVLGLTAKAADKKFSDLNPLVQGSWSTSDVFPIVDVSAGETKKTSVGDFDLRFFKLTDILSPDNGGTGMVAPAAGNFLYSNGTSYSTVGSACTNTQTIASNGSGSWACANNVSSVALSVPAFLSVTGSPITSSGTLAISFSGTALPLANGGTGQTTKAAAFDALSPMTTSGDIIYGGASGTGTRLAKGTDGQVLTLASGLPSWASATGKSAGEVFMTAATSCPSGTMQADGSSLLRSGGSGCGGGSCATLFAAISTTYGAADGTHFNLPDTRGVFMRGEGSQTISGTSYTGSQGTSQRDQMQGHKHTGAVVFNIVATNDNFFSAANAPGSQGSASTSGPADDGTNGTPRVGLETQPANIVLKYCIVY